MFVYELSGCGFESSCSHQKAYLKNVYYKLSHMLIDLKKNHALMFESIYTFESTNRFIYEHICIDLGF